MSTPFQNPVLFKYPTHACYIFTSPSSGRIHCVKYSERGIDWDHFEQSQITACQEFMITNIPEERWGFEED